MLAVRRPGDGIVKRDRKKNLSIVCGLHLPGSCLIDCSTLCIKSGRWIFWGSFCRSSFSYHAWGDLAFFTLPINRDRSEIQQSFNGGQDRWYRPKRCISSNVIWTFRVSKLLTNDLPPIKRTPLYYFLAPSIGLVQRNRFRFWFANSQNLT